MADITDTDTDTIGTSLVMIQYRQSPTYEHNGDREGVRKSNCSYVQSLVSIACFSHCFKVLCIIPNKYDILYTEPVIYNAFNII